MSISKRRFIATGVVTLALLTLAGPAPAQHPDDQVVFEPDRRTKASEQLKLGDAVAKDGEPAVIDVLVVYTPRMLDNLASSGDEIVPYVEATFAAVNAMFARSDIAIRTRVTGIVEWDRPVGYDLRQDFDALPAYVEDQTRLRDETAADLVQLWEAPEPEIDQPGLCGWGQIIGRGGRYARRGYGYSAVLRGEPGTAFENCYANSSPERFALLVAHELGHNLGSGHGWDDGGAPGAYDYAHGAYCGSRPGGNSMGTVMTTSLYRLPIFSSPELHHENEACGVPAGQPYAADNRQAFARTAPAIAKLRDEMQGRGLVYVGAPDSVAEHASWFPITLHRTDVREAASVELVLFSHRARPGIDFLLPARHWVNFAAGEAEIIVPVDLVADRRREADKLLSAWIQRGRNVAIAETRSQTVRIRDNAYPRVGEQFGPRPEYAPAKDETVASHAATTAGGESGGGVLSWAGLLALLLAGRGRQGSGDRLAWRSGRLQAPA